MNQENPFQLPDDYFKGLESKISAQTSESILERFRSALTNMEAVFRVPAYYFPRAQAALMNRLEDSRQMIVSWSWQDALRPALVCGVALLVSFMAFQNPNSASLDNQIAQISDSEIEVYLTENSNLIPDNQMAYEGLFSPTSTDTTSIISDSDLYDQASYELF